MVLRPCTTGTAMTRCEPMSKRRKAAEFPPGRVCQRIGCKKVVSVRCQVVGVCCGGHL